MNIKVFNIRLAKEFCQEDQAKMNAFLDSVETKLTSTSFVTTGTLDYWSAVIFYTSKTVKKEKSELGNIRDIEEKRGIYRLGSIESFKK